MGTATKTVIDVLLQVGGEHPARRTVRAVQRAGSTQLGTHQASWFETHKQQHFRDTHACPCLSKIDTTHSDSPSGNREEEPVRCRQLTHARRRWPQTPMASVPAAPRRAKSVLHRTPLLCVACGRQTDPSVPPARPELSLCRAAARTFASTSWHAH